MYHRFSGVQFVLAFFLAGCLTAGASVVAHASLITFQVTGTLTAFDGPALAPLAVGQQYSASFTFDSNAVATPVFGGGNDYVGAIQSASFSIGTYSGTLAVPAQTTIRVLNDSFGFQDEYLPVLGDINFGSPGVINAPPVTGPIGQLLPVRLALILLDDFGSPPDALSSSNLPLVPPDLSNFTVVGWNMSFQSSDESLFGRARGSIQSFTVESQVPEPSVMSILGLGLVAFAWLSLLNRTRSSLALT
jgi:hypothetical protein